MESLIKLHFHWSGVTVSFYNHLFREGLNDVIQMSDAFSVTKKFALSAASTDQLHIVKTINLASNSTQWPLRVLQLRLHTHFSFVNKPYKGVGPIPL